MFINKNEENGFVFIKPSGQGRARALAVAREAAGWHQERGTGRSLQCQDGDRRVAESRQGDSSGQRDRKGFRESQGDELTAHKAGRGAAGATQTPEEQNTFNLQSIKTANTRKTRRGNAHRECHGAAGGAGVRAPAPRGTGLTVFILYRA